MLSLKSIYYYFLAAKINLNNFFKKVYFSTKIYNDTLRTKIPNSLIFFPNAFLLSSLTNNKNFYFNISEVNVKNFWSSFNNSKERERLNCFLWLNLLNRKVNKEIIRKIIIQWIEKNNKYNRFDWDNSILSLRINSWILNSEIILENSNFDFKKNFLESIISQVNHLKKNYNSEKDHVKKIEMISAILLSGLVFKDYKENFEFGAKEINKIIENFFDNNGFPLTRNTEDLLRFIKFFIIMKECIKDAQKAPVSSLDSILEKNLICLSFCITPTNRLPLFNGCTDTDVTEFLNYLSNLNIKLKKNTKIEIGEFHLLKNKKDFIFFDVGSSPKKNFSSKYQSGPLAFEYFNDKDKIITNCGFGINVSNKAILLSKLTSAQSTLSIGNTSVVKFERNRFLNKAFGYSCKEDFKINDLNQYSNDNEVYSSASHNAYRTKLGFTHKREIRINKVKDAVFGTDYLFNKQMLSNTDYDIFFHLTPGLDAIKTLGGNSVLIKISKNKSMIFFVENENLSVEKSIFLGGNKILNNLCMRISGKMNEKEKIINWSFKKNI